MARLRTYVPEARDLATWALVAFLLTTYLQVVGVDQVDIYRSWAQELLAGRDPYGTPEGYPPLAMFAMAVPGLGDAALGTYRLAFAAGVGLCSLAGLVVAAAAQRRLARPGIALAYVLGVGAMGTNLLLSRYDLAPAVLGLGALAALARGRGTLAAALLGIGIALKPYLLVLLPLVALWELRRAAPARGRPRRLGVLAAWVVLPSVLAVAAMTPISGLADATASYGFQVTRAATQDSTAGVLVALSGDLGLEQAPAFDTACGCRIRDGEAMPVVRTTLTLGLVLGVLGLLATVWRRPEPGRVVVAANATLALLLLGYAVFSPQYMVWLAAPVCLLAGTRRGAVAITATAVATACAAYSYHLHYGEVIDFTGTGRWLVSARVVAQLVGLGAILSLLRTTPEAGARIASAPS